MRRNEHQISTFCKTSSGGTPSRSKPEYYNGTIPWVKSGELREAVVLSASEHVTEQAIKESSAKVVPAGALLVAMYGATIGRVAYLGIPAATNQAVCNIIPDESKADRQYLFYALRSKATEWIGRGAGGAQPNISQKIIRETKIYLPPLEEQKRIAAILDKADAIRKKRQQAIELTDQFLRSAFLDMFGDPITNPKSLQMLEVKTFCKIVRGSSPRPKGDPRYYGGSVPRLMVGDVTRDGWFVTPKIDSLTEEGAKKSRPVIAGTVVMAVSGNVGVMAQLQVNACVHDGFVAFTELNEDVVLPEYLMICLDFLRQTHENRKAGAIFQNLTTNDIKTLKLPVPPLLLQRKIINLLSQQLTIQKKFGQLKEISNSLFASLTKHAFRGEL